MAIVALYIDTGNVLRWCLLLALGCGSTTTASPTSPVVTSPVVPPPSPPVVVATTPPSAPPLALAPPAPVAATRQWCSPVPQPAIAASTSVRTYDFQPVRLVPNASGVIPAGYRRHPDSIRAAVSAEADSIASCTQDAWRRRVRPPPRIPAHFELDASLVIDPFGVPTTVTVEGDGDARFRECLRGVLARARVARRTPRETLAKVPLYLLGSYEGKAALKPAPVRTEPRTSRAGCVLAIDPLPRDTLDIPEVVIDWRPGDYGTPRSRCPARELDKAEIRRVMEDHRFAFEACFAGAPETRGRLDLQFVIGSHGVPTSIVAKGADPLHACVVAAMANVGFTRTEKPVAVNWSFTLDAPPTQVFAADCAGRAAYIETLSIHDPRAWIAIDELARTGCDFPQSLDRFARLAIPERRANVYLGRGTEEAIAATTKILSAFPAAAPRLLLFLAEGQLALGHEGDARTSYLRFLALPGLEKQQIERAAEGYARAAAERDDLLPLDVCEEKVPY